MNSRCGALIGLVKGIRNVNDETFYSECIGLLKDGQLIVDSLPYTHARKGFESGDVITLKVEGDMIRFYKNDEHLIDY